MQHAWDDQRLRALPYTSSGGARHVQSKVSDHSDGMGDVAQYSTSTCINCAASAPDMDGFQQRQVALVIGMRFN